MLCKRELHLIQPKKSLGQHFLHDPAVLERIVDSMPIEWSSSKAEANIIEIGPGTGRLTDVLLERTENVRAVEIDRRAIDYLRQEFPDLHIIEADVLKVSWDHLIDEQRENHIVGNLPYYITSQILFKILEERERLESATIMMQKEVAERLVADPGTKAYGILSVQVQLMSTPSLLFDVGPGAFTPPPKVNSSVVQLTFDRPGLICEDRNLKTVVRTAFQQRRKKLSNALSKFRPLPIERDLDYDKRAEAWPPSYYEKLTALLEQDGTLT